MDPSDDAIPEVERVLYQKKIAEVGEIEPGSPEAVQAENYLALTAHMARTA